MKPSSLGVLVMLTACGVRGNGKEATEIRDVNPFEAVENGMNIEVEVLVGDKQEVVITCDENLLALIQTDIRDGWLHIHTDITRSIRPKARCFATVTAPVIWGVAASGSGSTFATGPHVNLEEVHATGSGDVMAESDLQSLATVTSSGSGSVTVDDIDTDGAIDLDTSGSGKIYASGVADYASCHASGSGDIRAQELTVRQASIRVSGSGSVELTVTGSADATLSGSGDAVLFGHPQVTQSTSGSGDVILR